MAAVIHATSKTPDAGVVSLTLLDVNGDVSRALAGAGPLFRAVGAAESGVGKTIRFTKTNLGTIKGITVVAERS